MRVHEDGFDSDVKRVSFLPSSVKPVPNLRTVLVNIVREQLFENSIGEHFRA